MTQCLTPLPPLTDAMEPRLERFLELNARIRERRVLKDLYHHLCGFVANDEWPESLASLLGSTRSPAYKMFTQNASSRHARRRTDEWSRAVMGEPSLADRKATLLDLSDASWTGGGGWVLKGGLVLDAGVQPVEVARTFRLVEREGLVLNTLERLRASGHAVPVVTTRPDRDLVELMLRLVARTAIAWTGRLSSQFEFEPALLVQWLSPVPLQTLSVADALAAGERTGPGASGSFVWLQIGGKRWFVLYGPSRLGRYYLRSRGGNRKAAGEQSALLRLVEMIESRNLDLADFAIERLSVHRDKEDSYRRVTQAILMLWRFGLHIPADRKALARGKYRPELEAPDSANGEL